MRQIVLDTETTGRSPELGHRIIEIGAIVIQDREITQEIFHTYLNPQRASDPEALAVHGLSQTFLQDKPLFEEIINNLIRFLTKDNQKSEVIIHNAKFDTAFFNAEITRYNSGNHNKSPTPNFTYQPLEHYTKITDSLKLARKLHPNQRNSLDALCKRYNVDNSQRNLHGALLDAELLGQVYLKMTSGQGSFFDILTSSTTFTEHSDRTKNPTKSFNLPTCYANPSELQAHENQLTMIRKEAGTCLWENEQSNNRAK